MRALLPLAILLLAAGPALAQTIAHPITGDYEDVYVVAGRALDARGEPVRGGIVMVELEQKGVQAEPLRAGINCKGDFLVSFNLRQVDPRAKVKATVLGRSGEPSASSTVSLDPFYRRSNLIVTIGEEWRQACVREADVWDVSASLSARLLNRTEPYMRDGETFHARPYTGVIRLRYEAPDGHTICPPHPQDETPGACETFLPDERGDLRYTFTLDQPFRAGGRIEILLQEGGSVVAHIDPATRIAFANYEITGRGPPPELYDTPGPAFLALLALLALTALVLPRRRR
ncbi:MAG TPA: hypothetical protein VM582_01970 [Candidatus Thermoplasmatota archaeon]|nr:hypothetical protein [Candidatus Thermoplasmatota archaeon]